MRKKHRSKYEINPRNIELLKKYYPVDEEENTVTARFQYDAADDLIETRINPDRSPQIQPELLEKIQDMISRIPMPYRLKVELKVDDLQDQKPECIADSFRDEIELMRFSKRSNNRKMLFLSALLAIAGYFILGMMVVAESLGWFGSDFIASISEEVVDIAGWVFLWEAVTILFLESSERSVSDPGIRKRIASVSVLDSEGTVLTSRSHDGLFRTWGHMDNLQTIARHGLLLSGCGFIMFGLNGFFYLMHGESILNDASIPYVNYARILLIAISLCQIVAGIGGFYRFFGRQNVFTKFSKVYAAVMLFVTAIFLIVFCFSLEFKEILTTMISYSCTLVFIVSLFLDSGIKKKKK